MLLIPSFEVPDAFLELADRLDESRSIEWPPAASGDLEDQERMAAPLLQELLQDLLQDASSSPQPATVIVLGNAASAVLAALPESALLRVLLVDPQPYLPRDEPLSLEDSMEVFGEALSQTSGSDKLLAQIDQSESEAEFKTTYLDWLENDVLPDVEDPHQKRMMTSMLASDATRSARCATGRPTDRFLTGTSPWLLQPSAAVPRRG